MNLEQPTVISVNVGMPREADWAEIGRTSINKTATSGPVSCLSLGLEGDQVSDTKHHGGLDQAVYVFAREDLDDWAAEIGAEIRDGQFGENLTTRGIDVNAAIVGEKWEIGGAVLQVASVRTPCNDFKNWMATSGFDNTAWVKRFTATEKPGPYLRVLREGPIRAGDPIRVFDRPEHGVTVSRMFRALNLERSLLPELLQIDDLPANVRAKVDRFTSR